MIFPISPLTIFALLHMTSDYVATYAVFPYVQLHKGTSWFKKVEIIDRSGVAGVNRLVAILGAVISILFLARSIASTLLPLNVSILKYGTRL